MTEIRSFRRVFDLERRVYSVDRMRLNPAGIPLRGVLYLLALVAAAIAASATPLLGLVMSFVPWYLRDLGVPAAVAAALALVRIDGRAFHVAAVTIVRRRLRPRRLRALASRSHTGDRWRPPAIVMLPDGSDATFRRVRFHGPGAVLVLRDHVREGPREHGRTGLGSRRRPLRLRAVAGELQKSGAAPSGGTVIALAPGTKLEVRGERSRS